MKKESNEIKGEKVRKRDQILRKMLKYANVSPTIIRRVADKEIKSFFSSFPLTKKTKTQLKRTQTEQTLKDYNKFYKKWMKQKKKKE